MDIKEINVMDIQRYENNPRINEKAVEAVAESIRQFGWKQPLVIDKDNTIIVGDTRYQAALLLKQETAPCLYADNLTDDQIKAYRLADNKVGEIAKWDFDLLDVELRSIDLDMSAFGFDIADIEIGNMEDDTEDIMEPPEEPKAKLGDMYRLGNHLLLCGDSTTDDIKRLFVEGERADLVVTDPPYNVDYHSSDGKKIENDSMDEKSFRAFLTAAFKQTNDIMRDGAAFYIWHSESEGLNFRNACKDVEWQIRQCLIWTKNCFVLGRQDYQWQHEPCLYGWKAGSAHYFTKSRTQTTVMEKNIDIDGMKKDELKQLIKEMLSEIPASVIHEGKPQKSEEHPTMKPVKLIGRQIINSSQKGNIIYDPFAGSGTTLMSCEQLGRACRTVELDPAYVDVIINRWETMTGCTAEKI